MNLFFFFKKNTFTKHIEQVLFSLYLLIFYSLFRDDSVYQLSPPFCTFPLHIDTQDLSFLFMQIVLQSLYVLTLSTFSVPLATVVVQTKKKLNTLI